jgi:hypothetical protein
MPSVCLCRPLVFPSRCWFAGWLARRVGFVFHWPLLASCWQRTTEAWQQRGRTGGRAVWMMGARSLARRRQGEAGAQLARAGWQLDWLHSKEGEARPGNGAASTRTHRRTQGRRGEERQGRLEGKTQGGGGQGGGGEESSSCWRRCCSGCQKNSNQPPGACMHQTNNTRSSSCTRTCLHQQTFVHTLSAIRFLCPRWRACFLLPFRFPSFCSFLSLPSLRHEVFDSSSSAEIVRDDDCCGCG